MFYDLNVPWTPNDPNLPRTLAFLHELGYNVVALNHTITGKLPAELTCAIPTPPFPVSSSSSTPPIPSTLRVLRRVTLTLTETAHQNARLAALGRAYDVLALRPVDERTLQLACSSLDCDIIALDATRRYPFYFKPKMLAEAVRAGKRFEICYAAGVNGGAGVDPAAARRNLIANATQLIRATRGRGLLLCSEARAPAGCRGPWDVINLAAVWGLSQERGYEAMSKEARNAVVSAGLKKTGYKGVVDVIYGGEKPAKSAGEKPDTNQKQPQANKRKAAVLDTATVGEAQEDKPISKREAKRRAHKAKMAQSDQGTEIESAGETASATPTEQKGSG